jgi:hypothetical protein
MIIEGLQQLLIIWMRRVQDKRSRYSQAEQSGHVGLDHCMAYGKHLGLCEHVEHGGARDEAASTVAAGE